MGNKIWFGAASMLIGMIFLVRGMRTKTLQEKFSHIFLSLSFIYFGAYFLPIVLTDLSHRVFRLGMIITAGTWVIIQSIFDLGKWLSEIKLFRFRLPLRLPDYLLEIIRAVERLTVLKTGALIVVEREDSLEEYSKHAVHFDSEVNKDVIISIFHTSSPLHDGALLIRKGRMRGARMILPLATQSEVPLGLGTRHRSAIGITERTDAIALIVSEERGQMSISYKGKLLKAETAEAMSEYLSAVLKGKDPAEEKK